MDVPPSSGRTLAIGDIHGCSVAFDVLLSNLVLQPDDTLVVLGDVVDRGRCTRQVIDRLFELRQFCNLIFIKGNHEEMMLNALQTGDWMNDWLQFGGHETLQSYGDNVRNVPDTHLDFLNAGLEFWQTDSHIFVHANLEPGVDLDKQSADWLRWTMLTGLEKPHPSGKSVVCGHTAQHSGLPAVLDGWICIDTWVYGTGALTCLDVDTSQIYQSQETGVYRGGIHVDNLEHI